MTTAALDEIATLRDLLFGAVPGDPAEALTKSLREHGTVVSLTRGMPGLAAAVEREVATATDGLLSLNLADAAAAGWKKYDALRQAARRTRDAPGTEEIVALTTHTVESSHRPTVELFIDGRSVATIKIELRVELRIAGALAVVRAARLTAIRSGTCTVGGSLAIEQTVITKRQCPFDLPGAIRLRRGVALLEPVPSTPPAQQSVVGGANPRSRSGAWHADPTRRYEFRWWDGARWTQRVAANGQTMSDPMVCESVSGPLPAA
jgi:hypothetical protein